MLDLTVRRQLILSMLSETTLFSRKDLYDFLSESDDPTDFSLPGSDVKSLALLEESGFVQRYTEPGRGRGKYLYRRTERGTQLLSVLGIDYEE